MWCDIVNPVNIDFPLILLLFIPKGFVFTRAAQKWKRTRICNEYTLRTADMGEGATHIQTSWVVADLAICLAKHPEFNLESRI